MRYRQVIAELELKPRNTGRGHDRMSYGIVTKYLLVSIGGALGTAARYWVSGVVANHFGETFPWGTLIINVSGSLVIGFFATLTGPDGRVFVSTETRQFVMLGICGGFTTFSSFSLQTLNLARDGEFGWALANIGFSVALCLAAVWIGHIAATQLNQLRGSYP